MAERAARGKRRRPEVARFMLDPAVPLAALSEALARRSYWPGRARCFQIHEPKPRPITALPFRDRVVQHALIEAMLPALERWFVPQSYACRVGKGSHRALRRAVELFLRHEWLLRLDIRKFFPSIDHERLLELLLPRCPGELAWLVRRVLAAETRVERVAFHFPGDTLFEPLTRPHGLPIGNLTSQVWANAMLTPVDHLLASHLGLGSFVRYSDDLLVFSHDRSRLVDAWAAVQERCARLRLRLHPTKSRLVRRFWVWSVLLAHPLRIELSASRATQPPPRFRSTSLTEQVHALVADRRALGETLARVAGEPVEMVRERGKAEHDHAFELSATHAHLGGDTGHPDLRKSHRAQTNLERKALAQIAELAVAIGNDGHHARCEGLGVEPAPASRELGDHGLEVLGDPRVLACVASRHTGAERLHRPPGAPGDQTAQALEGASTDGFARGGARRHGCGAPGPAGCPQRGYQSPFELGVGLTAVHCADGPESQPLELIIGLGDPARRQQEVVRAAGQTLDEVGHAIADHERLSERERAPWTRGLEFEGRVSHGQPRARLLHEPFEQRRTQPAGYDGLGPIEAQRAVFRQPEVGSELGWKHRHGGRGARLDQRAARGQHGEREPERIAGRMHRQLPGT